MSPLKGSQIDKNARSSRRLKAKSKANKTATAEKIAASLPLLLTMLTIVRDTKKQNVKVTKPDVDGNYYNFDGKTIYHENQRANLCGKHALNTIMQGPVFDQKGLNSIAEKLNLKEQALLIDDMDTNPYNNSFGDYSIDVIEEALKIHNFHLLRSSNPTDLETAEAIIIHCNDHWTTLRKIGDHWIDFDSKLSQPVFLPDFNIDDYINKLLGDAQLFIVNGDLPEC